MIDIALRSSSVQCGHSENESEQVMKYYMVAVYALCTLLMACPPDATRRDAGPTPACLYEMTPVEIDAGVQYPYVERQFDRVSACVEYERFCNVQVWPVSSTPKCTPCCDICNVVAGQE